MKTLIAVPCFDMVHADFMQSLVNLQKPPETSWAMVKNTLIHDARNIIAANAIEAGFDRVMWFDSDMTFPPDTLIELTKVMDEMGVDVASGLYFTRRPPNIKPVAYKRVWYKVKKDGTIDTGAENYFDYPDNAITAVEAVGFGCCLTTVDILNRVGEKFNSPFDMIPTMGEDMSFCWRAKQLGAKIVLDTGIKCGHVGQYEYNEQVFKSLHDVCTPLH